jgi:hypothetical protein
MDNTINQLEKIIEKNYVTKEIKNILSIYLLAVNDWSTQVNYMTDFENEIFKFIGNEVDKHKLLVRISNIDYSKYAWEAESLSHLIEIYNYYDDNKPLIEIFNEIRNQINE